MDVLQPFTGILLGTFKRDTTEESEMSCVSIFCFIFTYATLVDSTEERKKMFFIAS